MRVCQITSFIQWQCSMVMRSLIVIILLGWVNELISYLEASNYTCIHSTDYNQPTDYMHAGCIVPYLCREEMQLKLPGIADI